MFFQLFLYRVFRREEGSFFIKFLHLYFCSACNEDQPDSPLQTDLNPESKCLLPIFGEWYTVFRVPCCLGRRKWETLLKLVIKLQVSNFWWFKSMCWINTYAHFNISTYNQKAVPKADVKVYPNPNRQTN